MKLYNGRKPQRRRHRCISKLAAATGVVAAALLCRAPAQAATVTWITDTSGSWSTASNWSSNPLLPGVNDDVLIDRGAADPLITITSNQSIRSLIAHEAISLSSGTLAFSTAELNSTFTLGNFGSLTGNLTNSGTFLANQTADGSSEAPLTWGVGLTFNNSGTLSKTAGGYSLFKGTINNKPGSQVSTTSGGLWFLGTGDGSPGTAGTHSADFSIGPNSYVSFGGSGHVINADATFTGTGQIGFHNFTGFFAKHPGAVHTVNAPWNYAGNVLISESTVNFNAPVNSTVNVGRTDQPNGIVNFNAEVNARQIINGTGIANFALPYNGSLTHNAGIANFNGGVTFTGSSSWGAGTLNSASKIVVDSGGTMQISAAGAKALNASLDNFGSINVNDFGGRLNISPGRTITNKPGATFSLGSTGTFGSSGAGAVFDNQGTFLANQTADGSSETPLAWGAGLTFNNSGTVAKTAGGYSLFKGTIHNLPGSQVSTTSGGLWFLGTGDGSPGTAGTHSASFSIGPNSYVSFGGSGHVINADATFTGTGQIGFHNFTGFFAKHPGAVHTVNAPWNYAGNVLISESTVNFNAPVNSTVNVGRTDQPNGIVNFNAEVNARQIINGTGIANFALPYTGPLTHNSGTANFNAGVTFTGGSSWSAGILNSSSTVRVDSSGSLQIHAAGGKTLNASLDNFGTINVNDFGARLSIAPGRTITNKPGATFSLGPTGTFGSSGVGATFDNQGTFLANQTADGSSEGPLAWGVGLTFNNTGTLSKTAGGYSLFKGTIHNVPGSQVSVTSGGLQFMGTGNGAPGSAGRHSGSFHVGPSSYISFNGVGHVINADAVFTGTGQIGFNNYTSFTTKHSSTVHTVNAPWSFPGIALISSSVVDFNAPVHSTLSVGRTDEPGGIANFNDAVNAPQLVTGTGTANFSLPYNGAITQNGGVANFNAGVAFTNASVWSAGTLNSAATIALVSGASLQITAGGAKTLNASLDNFGTINVNDFGARLSIAPGRTITNKPGATFSLGPTGTFGSSGSGATFDNQGTFLANQTADGSTEGPLLWGSALTFNNSGTLSKTAGGYSLFKGTIQNLPGSQVTTTSGGIWFLGTGDGTPGSAGTHSASFSIGPNSYVSFGGSGHVINADATFTGTGQIGFHNFTGFSAKHPGAAHSINAVWDFPGTVLISESTVDFNAPVNSTVNVGRTDQPNGIVNFNSDVNARQIINGTGIANFALPYIGELTHNGGTAHFHGGVTLSGSSAWSAGTLNSVANIVVGAGASLQINAAGAKTLNNSLDNFGTISVNDHGARLNIAPGKTVTNKPAATFSLGPTAIFGSSGAGALFQNEGTFLANQTADGSSDAPLAWGTGLTFNNIGLLTKTAGGYSLFKGTINNKPGSQVTTASGGLWFLGTGDGSPGTAGTHSASFSIGSGSYVSFGGSGHVIQPDAAFTGTGQIGFHGFTGFFTRYSGAVHTIHAPWHFAGNVLISESTVNFYAPVNSTVSVGRNDQPGGIVNFNAPVNAQQLVTGTGTANFNFPTSSGVTLAGGTTRFNALNTGLIDAIGGNPLVIPHASQLSGFTLLTGNWSVRNGAVLKIQGNDFTRSEATVTYSGPNSRISNLDKLSHNAGSLTLDNREFTFTPAGGLFTNSGTFVRSGSGTTTIPSSITFDNTGIVNVNAGTLAIAAAVPQLSSGTLTAGSWNIANNATLSLGSSSITSLSSDAAVSLTGPSSVFAAVNTLSANAGSFSISHGRAFTTAGSFTNTGTLSVGPGSTFASTGTMTIGTAGRVLLSSAPAGQSPGRLLLSGDLAFTGNGSISTTPVAAGDFPGLLDLGGQSRSFDVAAGSTGSISARLDNGSLNKTGIGTLLLSQANSYSGATTVSAGTLRLGTSAALPAASALTLHAGATLDLAGFSQSTASLAGAGDVLLGSSDSTTFATGTNSTDTTFSGSIRGSGAFIKHGFGSLTASGDLSFAGPLSVQGGTLILSGNNTFGAGGANTGSPITVGPAAVLSVSSDAHLGHADNSLLLNGGTFRGTASFSSARPIALGNGGGSVDVTDAHTFTLSGPLSGSSTLSKTGTGVLSLTDANTAFTGPVHVNQGVLSVSGADGALSNASSYAVDVTAHLALDNRTAGNHTTNNRLGDAASLTLDGGSFSLLGADNTATTESLGQLIPNSGASTINLSSGAGISSATLTFASLGTRGTGATLNFTGSDLGSSEKIFINGLSSGFLGGWATVNGSTFAKYDTTLGIIGLQSTDYAINDFHEPANGGDYHVRLDPAVSAPPIPTSVGSVSILTLSLDTDTAPITLTQNPASTLTLSQGGLIKSGANPTSIAGGTLTSTADDLNVLVEGGPLTLSSNLSGSFNLTKRGSGTLLLTGAGASNYSGITVVSGRLELDKPSGTIAVPGDLLVTGGEVIWLNDEQVADSADIILRAGTVDLNGHRETVANFHNFGGTFRTGAGGQLFVTSPTTWTLAGGSTTVNSGSSVTAAGLRVTGGVNTIESNASVNVLGNLSFDSSLGSSPTILLQSHQSTPGLLKVMGDVQVSIGPNSTASIASIGNAATRGTLDLNNGQRSFTITDPDATLLLSTRIINGSLRKAGAGTIKLTAPGTYSGGTTLSGGILEAADPRALGSGSITFSGGSLRLRSDLPLSDYNNPVTASPGNSIAIDADRISAPSAGLFRLGPLNTGGTVTLTGAGSISFPSVSLTGHATIRNDSSLSIEGPVNGSFNLTKSNPGTLSFAGNSPNTYTGTTRIENGTLRLSKPAGVQAVPAALSIFGPGIVQLASDEQINNNAPLTLTSTSAGTASLDLSDRNETVGALDLTGGVISTGSGTLSITANLTHRSYPLPSRISGRLSMGSTPRIFTVEDGAAAQDLIISANVSGSSPAGAPALTKAGDGTLWLSSLNNTFTGDILVSGGVLSVEGDSSLGAPGGRVILDGGTLLSRGPIGRIIQLGLNGASFDVPSTDTLELNQGLAGNGGITKKGTGTLLLKSNASFAGKVKIDSGILAFSADSQLGSSANALELSGGALRTASTLTSSRSLSLLGPGGSLDVSSEAAIVTLTGLLSGEGQLEKLGPGTLVLGGTQTHTHSGPMRISAGALRLGFPNRISDTAALSIEEQGTFDLNARTETVGSISGSGSILLNGGGLTLLSDASSTFSGPLSGSGKMSKRGQGMLLLSGDSSGTVLPAFSGSWSIEQGMLGATSDAALGSTGTPVSLAGGTFHASGTFRSSRTWAVQGQNNTAAFDVAQSHTLTLAGNATFATGTVPSLHKTGAGTLTLPNPSSFFPASLTDAVLSVNAGVLKLQGDAGSPSSYRIHAHVQAGQLWNEAPMQHLKSLSLSNGSRATLASPAAKIMAVKQVQIDTTSTLDLGAAAFVLHAETSQQRDEKLAELTTLVRSAYANGSWSGTGITSSSAQLDPLKLRGVALLKNLHPRTGQMLFPTLEGELLASNDLLAIGGVLYGDSDLDGRLTADDYARIDRAFLARTGGWLNGDSDHSGHIDLDDYTRLDAAFLAQSAGATGSLLHPELQSSLLSTLPPSASADAFPPPPFSLPPSGSSGSTAVPEPTTLAMISLATVLTCGLRRRKRKGRAPVVAAR